MSPGRHPSPTQLVAQARGRLAVAPGLAIELHVSGCAECAARVREFEEMEAVVLASLPPAPLAEDALAQTLDRLEAPAAPPRRRTAPQRRALRYGAPAAVAEVGVKVRRSIAPGFWAARVQTPKTDDWRAFLLHVPAGGRVPTHAHRGEEQIVVLKGSFHDGSEFRVGDFSENATEADHELRAGDDEPCLCLVALKGRVRWRGWARVAAPLLGL